MDRRKFISSSLISATLAALVRPALAGSDEKMSVETGSDDTLALPRLTNAGEMRGEMLYRRHPDWLGDDSPEVQKLAPQSAG